MIKVKISCAGTSIAKDNFNPMISKFLPGRGNVWRDCEFYWNDSSIKEADYWVVMGDLYEAEESCIVPKENIIFVAGEPPSTIRYDNLQGFIDQFYRVYLSHENVRHPRAYKCHPTLNWWIDSGHPIKSGEDFNKWKGGGFGYDDFKKMEEYNKTKLMSVFCSNKTSSPGHRARYKFCSELKNHFKDKIDWFGAGVQNLENKWDGMAPYKYHIALENSNHNDYWTEKLADAYMAGCYPIYSGAPNIHDYFNKNSITTIDIRYPKTSFAIIEKIIAEELYEKSKEKILEARNLVMDKYSLFNIVAEISAKDNGQYQNKELISLKNWNYFLKKNPAYLVTEKRPFGERIARSVSRKINKLKLFITDRILLAKLKMGID